MLAGRKVVIHRNKNDYIGVKMSESKRWLLEWLLSCVMPAIRSNVWSCALWIFVSVSPRRSLDQFIFDACQPALGTIAHAMLTYADRAYTNSIDLRTMAGAHSTPLARRSLFPRPSGTCARASRYASKAVKQQYSSTAVKQYSSFLGDLERAQELQGTPVKQ